MGFAKRTLEEKRPRHDNARVKNGAANPLRLIPEEGKQRPFAAPQVRESGQGSKKNEAGVTVRPIFC